jgi:hypothetical protein
MVLLLEPARFLVEHHALEVILRKLHLGHRRAFAPGDGERARSDAA